MLPAQIIQYKQNETTEVYLDKPFNDLLKLFVSEKCFVLTDKKIHDLYREKWRNIPCIVVPEGESAKTFSVVEYIINELIKSGADRNARLIGIGGGAVTDLAGFVAGIYKRGIRNILVPTSLLAMIDASIGGKNGVNTGNYKNMAGLIRQPEMIWYDYSFLDTLPDEEWINGFAEIIKHALIKDKELTDELKQRTWKDYRNDKALLADLIGRNVSIKTNVTVADTDEKNERKLLNFGHTLGHAIEHLYHLKHGSAIAAGMAFAAKLSEKYTGFDQTAELIRLLQQYDLPSQIEYDKEKVKDYINADKKKFDEYIHFILLEEIGNAVITPIKAEELYQYL